MEQTNVGIIDMRKVKDFTNENFPLFEKLVLKAGYDLNSINLGSGAWRLNW
jgi:hypothetical protein